jgi:hypothetical protein
MAKNDDPDRPSDLTPDEIAASRNSGLFPELLPVEWVTKAVAKVNAAVERFNQHSTYPKPLCIAWGFRDRASAERELHTPKRDQMQEGLFSWDGTYFQLLLSRQGERGARFVTMQVSFTFDEHYDDLITLPRESRTLFNVLEDCKLANVSLGLIPGDDEDEESGEIIVSAICTELPVSMLTHAALRDTLERVQDCAWDIRFRLAPHAEEDQENVEDHWAEFKAQYRDDSEDNSP